MKINNKIFSIPPYISTHWGNVNTLSMKSNVLVVSTKDGEIVEIPNLDASSLENIFSYHASFMEQNSQDQSKFMTPISQAMVHPGTMQRLDVPFRLGLNSVDDIGSVLQHNPSQANTPEIPQEILHKIVSITKIVSPEGIALMPKPEPSCNCVHCQIARALSQEIVEVTIGEPVAKEEEVSEADLVFEQWQITPTGNQLYSVVNKLDTNEKYNVFLGKPVGCTCGKTGCEHIVAVLKS
jgi:hypothetical protein